MSLKKILLAFFGLCVGGVIAAGAYAFLAIIGVLVRLMGKTDTRKHIILYEVVIVSGGALGNIVDIYEFPIYMGGLMGTISLTVASVCVGTFVGCLVTSPVKTLKVPPVVSRRIHLAVGLQYLIFALVAGKLIGSLVYFWLRVAPMG